MSDKLKTPFVKRQGDDLTVSVVSVGISNRAGRAGEPVTIMSITYNIQDKAPGAIVGPDNAPAKGAYIYKTITEEFVVQTEPVLSDMAVSVSAVLANFLAGYHGVTKPAMPRFTQGNLFLEELLDSDTEQPDTNPAQTELRLEPKVEATEEAEAEKAETDDSAESSEEAVDAEVTSPDIKE